MRRLVALAILVVPAFVSADERILSFHSDVLVLANGNIEVTETIAVRSEGHAIERGIYRDFPVEYRDSLGNNYEITVVPLAVTRNGQSEDFHSKRSGRDVRVYFGRSDRFINNGEHTYVFRYSANRLLGYFEHHDELYWNVTGFRWAFPIDKASATIRLDFEAPVRERTAAAYTGRKGSKAQNFRQHFDLDGNAHFQA